MHSYLIVIVKWSDHDKVAMNVGFYYLANTGGRLVDTLLSSYLFQQYGPHGCLIASSLFIMHRSTTLTKLPHSTQETR